MAREHPAYRDTLEDVLTFLDGRRTMTQADICRYTGKSPKWVKAHIGVGNHKIISAAVFADKICRGA